MVKSVFSCFRFMRSLSSNFALHVVQSWGDGRAAHVCGAEGKSKHEKQKWLKPLNPKSPRTARTLSGQFFGFNTIKI